MRNNDEGEDEGVCVEGCPALRVAAKVRHRPDAGQAGIALRYVGWRHYREAVRSRSDAEYISKVEGALQELEETGYWLELLADSGVCKAEAVAALRRETDELTAMLVACAKKAKAKTRR